MTNIPPALTERVLTKLGFSSHPTRDLDGLTALYSAWCRKVPFDNVRKLIHVNAANPGPLPGDSAEDFFHNWLIHGTGGTCWAGNGALHALLSASGFDASRGVATMLVAPDIPPNHGTVIVTIDGHKYVVDASILHDRPVQLKPGSTTVIDNPAWGVKVFQPNGLNDRWVIEWKPLLHPGAVIPCRIEKQAATKEEFQDRHEHTRAWSPFNFELCSRLIRGNSVVGAATGQRVELDGTGKEHRRNISLTERKQLLIEELGMSEEIVSQLPEDRPTPPPPGSQTAQAIAQAER